LPKNARKLLTAEVALKRDLCSEAKMRDHVILIDSSKDEGGADLGPVPTELFLAALGGCIMINISRIARRMRIDLRSVRMKISGIKEHNEHPSSFTELHVNVAIDANTNDNAKLGKLVRLAEENCTVSNTLRKAVVPIVRLA
jgi:putative redox protein